ncbi:unnamed protein product, partial [Arctogadus glacialis]
MRPAAANQGPIFRSPQLGSECFLTAEYRWVGVEMEFCSLQILLLPPTLLFLLPWGKRLIIIQRTQQSMRCTNKLAGEGSVRAQQAFVVEPRNTTVRAGSTAVLRCGVLRASGVVQWLKDGLLLGPQRGLPGFPRYSIQGDPSRGQFHLQVERAELDDEGPYECQVGGSESSQPISSNLAWLDVLMSMEKLFMPGLSAGGRVLPPSEPFFEVASDEAWVAGRRYAVVCVAPDAKPEAQIQLYKDGVELMGVESSSETGSDERLWTTRGEVTVLALSSDDGSLLTCLAKNSGASKPSRTSLTMKVFCEYRRPRVHTTAAPFHTFCPTLPRVEAAPASRRSVLAANALLSGGQPIKLAAAAIYPPRPPVIRGLEGDQVKAGSVLRLVCVSQGGNPLAVLNWMKNGEVVTTSWQEHLEGDLSSATLQIKVEPADNQAVFSCLSLSLVMSSPLAVSRKITVICSFLLCDGSFLLCDGSFLCGVGCFLCCDDPFLCCHDSFLCGVGSFLCGDDSILCGDGSYLLCDDSFLCGDGSFLLCDDSFLCGDGSFLCGDDSFLCGVGSFVCPDDSSLFCDDSFLLFEPAEVDVEGSYEVVEGDHVELLCLTTSSNPPASIRWWLGSRELNASAVTVREGDHGGSITTSNLTHLVSRDQDGLPLTCEAFNPGTRISKIRTESLIVLYPPLRAWLSAPPPGPLRSGTRVRLFCFSTGGNPMATLTWLKNGRPVSGAMGPKPFDKGVSRELALVLVPGDNMAPYQCEAGNEAGAVMSAETRLQVLFPAVSMRIVAQQERSRAGQSLGLQCLSGSSNPKANVSWILGARRIPGEEQPPRSAVFGGVSVSSSLTLPLVPSYNKQRLICQAYSAVLSEGASTFHTLDVMYPPEFSPAQPRLVQVTEEDTAVLPLLVSANPEELTCTWLHHQDTLITDRDILYQWYEDYSLQIRNVTRRHTGKYTVQCTNEEGRRHTTITLDVLYSPGVRPKSAEVRVDLGAMADLICAADANPAAAFSWAWLWGKVEVSADLFLPRGRHVAQEGEGEMEFEEETMEEEFGVLTIQEVTRAHAGRYQCTADNGIAPPASAEVELVVCFGPEIKKGVQWSKVASRGDGSVEAEVLCRAEGIPPVSFSWDKNNVPMDFENPR